jgi:hypothetical protein
MQKIYQTPTNVLGFMDVISLHNGHQHVSASHVAFFRVLRARIQNITIIYVYHYTVLKIMYFLLKFTVEQ